MTRGAAAGLVLAACLAASAASAHAPGASRVHPVLGVLPPALHGVTVEVAETLAPELLVANHGGATLEVLDPAGRAFVRIGPKGVEADLAAAAWYETIATARPPVPQSARDPAAPPHWATVQSAPSWGWFDPRLNVTHVKPRHDIAEAEGPVSVGAWSIPVRIDGQPARIEGRFEFRPDARGAYVARIETPADFPTSIAVHVSQGATPALFLQNAGPATVTVLGLAGEPTIRIGPDGVAVNTGSSTWQQFGREERALVHTAGERWLHVSKQPAYTWLEPRGTTDAQDAGEKLWAIPVLVGDRVFTLRGTSAWQATGQ